MSPLTFLSPTKLVSDLFKAWETGNPFTKRSILAGSISLLAAIGIVVGGNILYPRSSHPEENKIVLLLFGAAVLVAVILYMVAVGYVWNYDREKIKAALEEKEKQLAEHPDQPALAWDLARAKLEGYLDRNLSQVNSIYYLSVFVMLVGFGLIIYGSVMVFQSEGNLDAGIVVSVSGAVLDFIGASFLILYKSTMGQAEKYVMVLERINAVGMSLQVIDSMGEGSGQLKDETKAELAKQLIELYKGKAGAGKS